MTSLHWTIGSFIVLQAVGWGIFVGTTRATLKAIKEDVAQIPAVINGTVVRKHEDRCVRFLAHRQDETDPAILS